MAVIDGPSGIVRVGATEIAFVTEWSADLSTEITQRGPYINNPNLSKSRGGRDCTGSITADIPAGRDAGQTTLVNAQANGTNVVLELNTADGYTLDVPSAIITNVNVTQSATDGVTITFDFEDGAGTHTLTATT